MIKKHFTFAAYDFRKIPRGFQYLISTGFTLAIAATCYLCADILGYKVVALLLMLSVSLTAMLLDIIPVLLAAILSALLWNYFFIPPKFSFHINTTEDALMFLMYFVIALVNAVLSHKIRKVEKEISRKEEKENTLRLYSTILNSLSHELRTPISTIIGASDNLQTMSHKLTEHDKQELLTEISKSSLKLNRQVENLLNMSRLESGFIKVKMDWLDVRELIYEVIHQLDEIKKNRTIQLELSESLPYIRSDYGLLSQILHNLLHNALVHVSEDAEIFIRAQSNKTHLILSVEDSGSGFPENEIENVFQKFYRLRQTSSGGTGLGLSIVKGFVEALNGSIKLENKPRGGALFTIKIPIEILEEIKSASL